VGKSENFTFVCCFTALPIKDNHNPETFRGGPMSHAPSRFPQFLSNQLTDSSAVVGLTRRSTGRQPFSPPELPSHLFLLDGR
jgi:hypothetical protein